MRLWSLHPKYLDRQGLLAVWREGLLAQKVLQNKTRGYTRHPQLDRFRQAPSPLDAIGRYLEEVYKEACRRGYSFNEEKIDNRAACRKIPVTRGQVEYEWRHLRNKLKARSPDAYRRTNKIPLPEVHPLFRIKAGEKEPWEK